MLLAGFGCKVVLRNCILSRCCLRHGGARWLAGVYTSQNHRGRMMETVTRLALVSIVYSLLRQLEWNWAVEAEVCCLSSPFKYDGYE